MKRFIFLLYILLSVWGILNAIPSVLTKHYTTETGLPNNTVNCILKDREGFMWFGTWYGLCRYDGYRYQRYTETSQPLLKMAPRKIQTLVEDKWGILWIKTIDGKLYTFNKQTETFHFMNDEMKSLVGYVQVIKIQCTEDGQILILTKDKNLFLASSDQSGKTRIDLLCEVKSSILNHNWQLKENILSETDKYVCWIGMDYTILLVEKSDRLRRDGRSFIVNQVLAKDSSKLTAVSNSKDVLWVGDSKGNITAVDIHSGMVNRFIFPQIQGEIESLSGIDNNLYFSVRNTGVYHYDISSKKLSKIFTFLVGERVKRIFTDVKDLLCFETTMALVVCDSRGASVGRYNWTSRPIVGEMKISNWDKQYVFVLTPMGEVWVIDKLSGEKCAIYELGGAEDNMVGQVLTDLYVDREDGIWLASANSGVYSLHFPGNMFKFLKSDDWFHLNESESKTGGIRALYQTHDGLIWVGTRWKTLYCLDREGHLLKTFSDKEGYEVGNVYHIMEDSKGNLWFSTKGNGLIKASPVNSKLGEYCFTRYRHSENIPFSISSDDVYLTYEDSKGRIWVGTFGGGLNLYDDSEKKPVFYNIYNDLGNYPDYGQYREIRTIVEDDAGRIWIGTTDGLMSLINDFENPKHISFETYRSKNSSGITENDVYVLYKDASSSIWGSVFGGGLLSFSSYDVQKHTPEFVLYGIKDGINNNVVLSIVEDFNKDIWFATENGVSRYNRRTRKINNFDRYDGFPNVRVEENVMLHTSLNEVWIGTHQGIIKFSPNEMVSHKLTSPVYVLDFKVSNSSLEVGDDISVAIPYVKEVTLNHDQSMFALEFAALNYAGRFRVSYKYILQGYEEEWHFSGSNRIASYTNVPPGKYTFIVEAIDHTDSSLISERKINITILPPWWATWWAYGIYLLLLGVVLYASLHFVLWFIRMKNDIYIEQKLSELKIKFFTNISHELRTPLTLIKGPIQELKEKEKLSERGLQYVCMMERSTHQMLQLVNQILDFRKIQNGKMRLHVSAVNLADMLNSICEEFRIFAAENEILFEVVPVDTSIVVWVDAEKFGVVVRNILSNAFKYTPQGGKIKVEVGEESEINNCRIWVSDNGIGIPADKLEEIFERFSQGNNNSNVPYKGTGIGLALSKELINMHHGTIHAESNGGQGVTFIIDIPLGKDHFKEGEVDFYVGDIIDSLDLQLKNDEDSGENMESEEGVDTSRPVVLLVEDNRDLCLMLKMQLEDKFNVFMASNGVEGLKKVEKIHPDLIVTDQMMPEMDGMEMLHRIKSDFQTSHIPIIMLTAQNNENMKQKAYAAGANAYVTKPFSKEFLIARIGQLLADRRRFVEQLYQSVAVRSEIVESTEQLLEKKDIELLEKVHQVIEDNLDSPDFNIDSIAQSVGLSRSAFFKKLKSLSGLAPVDLVKEVRLNKSVELMKTTDLSISEIAYAVGFRDAGYFSKCFRKKYNQNPREYISQWRKN